MGMTFSLWLSCIALLAEAAHRDAEACSCAALVYGEGQRGGDRTRLHHWPRARKMGGPMGRGLRQKFVQQMGNRHHRRATHLHRGSPPRQGGEGGIYRLGITYNEFRFSSRPAAGARELGRGGRAPRRPRRRVTLGPSRGETDRGDSATADAMEAGGALPHEVPRRAGVWPCSCRISYPALRHAMGHGRRRACRHGLGVVMGHASTSVSSGAHAFTPRPCANSTRTSRCV
jgi:hypothetical protein